MGTAGSRPVLARTVLARTVLVAVVPAVIAGCGQQPGGTPASAGGTQPTGSATAVPSASGTPAATVTPAAAGPPAGNRCGTRATPARYGTLTLGAGDTGTRLCVRTGTAVLVFLHGSAGSRWTPVRVSSADLAPHPNPAFTLALWVTGGSFLAVHPGTVVITSSRPACGSGPQGSGPAASGGPNCPAVTGTFRVTLVITR